MHWREQKRFEALRPFLTRLSGRYHSPDYLGSDPLVMVHAFKRDDDREVAALFAALLAYGNVKQINRSLATLFEAMDRQPAAFIRDFRYANASAKLRGFKHRFTDVDDVLCLCWLLHQAMRSVFCRKSSGDPRIEDVFLRGYREEESDLVQTASRFIDTLFAQEFAPYFDRDSMIRKASFKHLLPRADRGSACKRIHLWLRWMIRADDGIDLGLWKRIPASKLLMPLDTHLVRIGHNLGLINTAVGSLKSAREMTRALAVVDPDDPVRFDFAVCRLGILKMCPTSSNLEACKPCEMHDVCRKRKALAAKGTK